MSAFFDALGTGRLTRPFTEDVTWTTVADGTHITGPAAVEETIALLQARLGQLQTRQVVFGPDSAYLEGSAAGLPGQATINYCVAYDIVGEQISAMRADGIQAADQGSSGTR